MAFLGRDGQTVNSLGSADKELDDMIQEAAGEWIAGGQRTIFSEHLYRRIVPADSTDEEHMELGDMAIAAVIRDVEGSRSEWFSDASLVAAGVFIGGTSDNSGGAKRH